MGILPSRKESRSGEKSSVNIISFMHENPFKIVKVNSIDNTEKHEENDVSKNSVTEKQQSIEKNDNGFQLDDIKGVENNQSKDI